MGREVVFGSGTYTHGSPRLAGLSRWKRTAASPSGSKARKRRPGDWVFLVSHVAPHPYQVHQRPGPQDLRLRSFLAYAPRKGVVRQRTVWGPRNVDGLDRERVEHAERPPMRSASGLPTASADKTGASKHTFARVYPTSEEGALISLHGLVPTPASILDSEVDRAAIEVRRTEAAAQ